MADKINQEQLNLADQLNQKMKQSEITAKQFADALKEAGLEQAHLVNLIDEKIAKLQKQIELQGESEAATARINELLERRNQIADEGAVGWSNLSDEQKKLVSDIQDMNKHLDKGFGFMRGFTENIAKGGDSMQYLANGAKELGKSLVTDFMIAFAVAAAEGFLRADKLTTEFNKMSGTAGAMNNVILGSASGMGHLGVSTTMAANAVGALYQDFNKFSDMNQQSQMEMAGTVASLENVGIASAQTAANIDLASNAFGMSIDESVKLQDEMAATAIALGMPPAKLAGEFQKAAPQLSAYGKEGVKVFKNMAAASKGLGIEMSTLLGITEKMDTFEGAAESAGRLNAMLGGDLLNSVDLLNASEDERLRMMLESVELSGRNWDAMSKFEKKALASAAGITDMAEANKLFGGGLDAYDESLSKMEENKVAEEELAAAKAASVSVTDKMSLMFDQMAAAMAPLVSAIHWMLDGIISLNDSFGGYLIPTLAGFIALIILGSKAFWTYRAIMSAIAVQKGILAGVSWVLAGSQTAQSTAQTAVAATAGPAAAGTSAMGIAATAAAPGVAALAIGIGLLALGIGLVALSIAAIIWAFVYLIKLFMESPMAAIQAAGALLVMGAAVAALAVMFAGLSFIAPLAALAMGIIAAGLLPLGIAVFILGAGLTLFGTALSLTAAGMSAIAAVSGLFAESLTMLVGPLFLVVPQLMLLGMIAPLLFFAAFGIFMLAMALPLLAASLLLVSGLSTLFAISMMILSVVLPPVVEYVTILGTLAPVMLAAAIGLTALGIALPIFGAGILALGFLSSLPFFDTGLDTMVSALQRFADAMSKIPAGSATALGNIFMGLAVLTEFDDVADVFDDLTTGILKFVAALSTIPEESIAKMRVLYDDGLNPMAEIGNSLTPETVESARGLVDEAQRYIELQGGMKSVQDDAFVQMALANAKAQQASAEAQKATATGGGKGQDVVLVLNERELGRAIEAVLNKRINLGVS